MGLMLGKNGWFIKENAKKSSFIARDCTIHDCDSIIFYSVLAEKETCGLLQKGVAAIFGPQTLASSEHIRSITDVAEVPFIDTKWSMHPVNPILTSNQRDQYTVNLHPDVTTLGKS